MQQHQLLHPLPAPPTSTVKIHWHAKQISASASALASAWLQPALIPCCCCYLHHPLSTSTTTPTLLLIKQQVVLALGPVSGRLPDGTFGFIDNMSPERVEAQGDSGVACCGPFSVWLVLVWLLGSWQSPGLLPKRLHCHNIRAVISWADSPLLTHLAGTCSYTACR